MLSILSTSHALIRKTPAPAGPSPLQTGITFPTNIGNNINAVSYNYASGSGTTAYLNGTYTVNCSSSEALPAQNGGVLCLFNANGSAGTYFWGNQYGSGGYVGCTSTTLNVGANAFPYSAYVYVNSGTYNTITTGEWVSIALPYWIKPTSFQVRGRNYAGGGPRFYPRTPNGYIFQGSNNNSTWTSIYTQANPTLGTASAISTSAITTINVTTSNSFKYFRFVITSIVGTGDVNNTQANCSLCWFGITGDSYSSAI